MCRPYGLMQTLGGHKAYPYVIRFIRAPRMAPRRERVLNSFFVVRCSFIVKTLPWAGASEARFLFPWVHTHGYILSGCQPFSARSRRGYKCRTLDTAVLPKKD
jgi:hypothetical protein